MTKKVFSLIAAATLTTVLPSWFSVALSQEVPASAVSCHFVARAYLNIDSTGAGMAEVAGYITDIPGITDPLFSAGTPSENNAFLTFRSDPVVVSPVAPNGAVTPERASAGTFNIYFNPLPNGRDWNNPNTFSNGATFPGNPLVRLMRDQSLFYLTDTLARHDVTEHLISSQPFVLPTNGHKYDLGTFVPAGFTLWETYSTKYIATERSDYPIALPGAGNCTAVVATATEGENQWRQNTPSRR
jgi:hypothetical protein